MRALLPYVLCVHLDLSYLCGLPIASQLSTRDRAGLPASYGYAFMIEGIKLGEMCCPVDGRHGEHMRDLCCDGCQVRDRRAAVTL
jgi:hypothetical protein